MPESEESSVSREQVSKLDVDDVINLDSDEDSIGQLDYSGTRLDDEYVEVNMHTDGQPSIDDQSSSGSSEFQIAAVGSGDLGNIVQHNIHLNDHQKLTLLKKYFVPPSDYKFPHVQSMEFTNISNIVGLVDILDWYIQNHKMEVIVNTVFCLAKMSHP